MTFKIPAIALALALAPLATYAQTDASLTAPDALEATATSAPGFAAHAVSGNQFEITSSEIALKMTKTPEVVAFAEKMIADHTAAGKKMLAAAQADGVEAPVGLMPDHMAQVDALSKTEADSFDVAYLASQVAAHNETVMLFQAYSENGQPGALKDFATETLPTLEMHLTMVGQMSGS